jgi:hypothetical protein
VSGRVPVPGTGRRSGPLFGIAFFAIVLLPSQAQLRSLWGTDWMDHLRLLLPLGIVVLLLVKVIIGARRRFQSSGPVLLYTPLQPPPSHPAEPHPAEVYPGQPYAAQPQPVPPHPTTQARAAQPRPTQPRATPAAPPFVAPPLYPRQPVSPPVSRVAMDESPTIRFNLSEGVPLEFLPGRLEILEGLPSDQEFRFQRTGGAEAPEVTLGRSTGPSYRHIQLPAPTVSRLHARMRFEGEQWVIANLSEANPLWVNGRPLDEQHVLVDGDEIQVGEVLLRYRDGRR